MTTILKGHRPHELLFFYIAGDILFATIRDGGDMRAAEWTDGLWRPIAIEDPRLADATLMMLEPVELQFPGAIDPAQPIFPAAGQ